MSHMLVDNCAMQLVKTPGQFDVILTENMFGDILSDEASEVTGSIGMLSSASLGATKLGLYERATVPLRISRVLVLRTRLPRFCLRR